MMGSVQKASEALETWLYELNERNHWFFRLLEAVNDLYAGLIFRGVRRRAARIDESIRGRDREFRMRFLVAADAAILVELFAQFDFAYSPPHSLEADAVQGLLARPEFAKEVAVSAPLRALTMGLHAVQSLSGQTLAKVAGL